MRALQASRQSAESLPQEPLRDLERHIDVEEVPWDGREWEFGED